VLKQNLIVLTVTLLLLGVPKGQVQASIVSGLYEAKVMIPDQLQRSRKKAETEAFKKVLVKVTGSKSVLKNALIIEEINKASIYLLSYSYETDENSLFYSAKFDQQNVERLITQNGFPLWDRRRPDTIAWLAIQPMNESKRYLASESESSLITDSLFVAADDRGINISLPIVDLTDLQALSVNDVWAGFSATIKQASERYGTDYVLSARVYYLPVGDKTTVPQITPLDSDSWVADWTFQNSNSIESGKLIAKTDVALSTQLIDLAADILATKYAINTQNSLGNRAQLTLTNVDTLTRYNNIVDILGSLSVVSRVTLLTQQGSFATFELELLGDADDLANALSLDEKIKPTLSEFGQPTEDNHYIWKP
jgi:hypothetical protein